MNQSVSKLIKQRKKCQLDVATWFIEGDESIFRSVKETFSVVSY